MFFEEDQFTVSKITLAIFLSKGIGSSIHRDRPTHGIAFYADCSAIYRFESGEELTCRSGEVIYLPKNSNYTVSRYEENDAEDRGVYAINFTVPVDPLEQNECAPFVMKIKGADRIRGFFSKAANAWSKKELGYYESCMSDLYAVVRLMKKEHAEYTPLEKNRAMLNPAMRYINENYTTDNISIAHLADLCKISEPYLRRLFHRTFSVSPAVYIRNLRIKYAKELLLTGEYSVTEAASLSGFNDAAYFSREFKKATGISPKEYP